MLLRGYSNYYLHQVNVVSIGD